MSDFNKDIRKVMEYRQNPFDVYLIEENSSSAISEKVRLYSAKQCLRSKNYNVLPEAMVELSNVGHLTNTSRDPSGSIKTAVKLFRTNSHLEESWKIMGQLIDIAHKKYDIDLTEELSRYKEDEINLLEVNLDNMEPVNPNSFISNTVSHDITYTSKTKYNRKRNDTGMAVKVDYPIEQPVDIWKGETMPNTEYLEDGEEMVDIDDDSMTESILDKDSDDPCWDGYVQLGTKMKDGKEVPNCVPIEESRVFHMDPQKFKMAIPKGTNIVKKNGQYVVSVDGKPSWGYMTKDAEDALNVAQRMSDKMKGTRSPASRLREARKTNRKTITESVNRHSNPVLYSDHLSGGLIETYNKINESTESDEIEILTYLHMGDKDFQPEASIKKELGSDAGYENAIKSLSGKGYINKTSKGVGITKKGETYLMRKVPSLKEETTVLHEKMDKMEYMRYWQDVVNTIEYEFERNQNPTYEELLSQLEIKNKRMTRNSAFYDRRILDWPSKLTPVLVRMMRDGYIKQDGTVYILDRKGVEFIRRMEGLDD